MVVGLLVRGVWGIRRAEMIGLGFLLAQECLIASFGFFLWSGRLILLVRYPDTYLHRI